MSPTGASPAVAAPVPKMFAVLGQTNVEKLSIAIKEKYPNDNFPLANGQWILVIDGTAKGLSDSLGISDGSLGATAVVVLFTSYFGRASTQLWEWIASKMGTPHG